MFRKISALSSFALLACTAAVFWFHGRLRPEDALRYQELAQESQDLHSKRALENHPARQMREEVQKDIWVLHNGKRTHFQIKSESSELIIRQSKDKFEATEHLKNLESFLEEDGIRHLLAKEGSYFYPSHRFLIEEPEFSFYPANNLETPLLHGTALSATLNAVGNAPTLFAHGVKGIFDSMHCEAEEMSWLREGLSLTGNVHLFSAIIQGKKSFAIADALTYNPRDKTLILSSAKPKKVLFWQEGTRLSAAEVRVRRDPITQIDSIEGVGDVRFSFDLAEENAIQQLFGKYL